jgi:hypothetical protein
MSTKSRVIVLAAVAALALAGCAPVVSAPTNSPAEAPTTEPIASATPSATPTLTPTPTPTASASADANVLFTMKATAVATGSNGATEDLTETVYAPTTRTADPIGDTKLLAKQCPGYQTLYPKLTYLVFTMTATAGAGSATWPKDAVQVLIQGGSAISGDGTGYEGECAGGNVIDFPGKLHAIEVFDATASPDSRRGWAKEYEYGFDLAVDGPKSSVATKDLIEFTNCSITLGTAAAADPIASTWTAQLAKHKVTDRSCLVGNTGF